MLINCLITFLEGIITFVSPCLLPMIPIYLVYFAGGGERNTKNTIKNALGFVLGFTIVFLALGLLAGFLSALPSGAGIFIRVAAGLVVIFLGLSYLGVIRGFSLTGLNVRYKGDLKNLGFFSSLLFGLSFGIGWTPCIGTFLGSALMLASNQETVGTGMILLLFYSLGLGIPFLLAAVLIDQVKEAVKWVKTHYVAINRVSGIFLIVIGVLMAAGVLEKFTRLLV